MRQTISLKLFIGVMLVYLCVTVGCQKGDTEIITASPANGPTVRSAIEKAQGLLDQDEDIDVILTTLEDQLNSDPRVYDVEVESEIGSVSFVFNNGETHTIALRDAEFDSEIILPYLDDLAYDSQSTSLVVDSAEESPLQQQSPLGGGYYRMPANNKALLANAFVYFHGRNGENTKDPKVVLTDSTEIIEGMLKARGYKVKRPTEILKDKNGNNILDNNGNIIIFPVIPVELFKTLTDYSVILIETHGGRRNLRYPFESTKEFPNCGGAFSKYQLVTTEIATMDSTKKYMNDIICGRVAFHNKLFKTKDGGLVQVYDITPNYIRQYNPGKFPDNTLMMLNACSADKSDTASPSTMKALLFEKSNKGARFLGWNGNADVSMMGGASLNLFQLMTASNEKLTVKGITFLKKSTPPQGGRFTPLTKALEELDKKSYLTDPKYKTKLQLTSQDGADSDLILMPHPLTVWGALDWVGGGSATLFVYCDSDSQPTVNIGETEIAVSANYGDSMSFTSVPVGAYGDIVVRENERTSIPRLLHRWRPQIKVKSISSPEDMPFMQYDVTFTMQARATIGSGLKGSMLTDPLAFPSFRDSIWNDPPPAQFAAWWDLSASNVAWKIDGEGSDGETYYKYEGSGLKPLTEGVVGGDTTGIITNDSGTSVSLSIDAALPFTFTMKVLETGDVLTYEGLLPIWVQKDNITLSDDWGVFQASFQSDDICPPIGCMAQISWNQFSADPPFDKDNEPR